MTNWTETPSLGELLKALIGLVLIAIIWFCGYVIWSASSVGRPASLLSMAALLAAGIFTLSAEEIKKIDPSKKYLSISLSAGLLSNTAKAALWTGVGLCTVWGVQLFLYLLPSSIEPGQAAHLQLQAHGLADRLKGAVTPFRFVLIVAGTIAVSLLLDRIWPVNAAGAVKKWLGAGAAVLIAFSSMTFVRVQPARVDATADTAAVIRATIETDLGRLLMARQEGSALEWIRSSLETEAKESPKSVERLHQFVQESADLCMDAAADYDTAYRDELEIIHDVRKRKLNVRPRSSSYCAPYNYVPKIVRFGVQKPGDNGKPAEDAAWYPEFRESADNLEHLDRLTIPSLRDIAGRVSKSAHDEEKAKKTVEAAAVSALSRLIGESSSGFAEVVIGELKKAVLEAIVRDNREKVALWLRLRRAPMPLAAKQIMGIEPDLKLEVPSVANAKAGDPEKLALGVWKGRKDYVPDVKKAGRLAAQREVSSVIRVPPLAKVPPPRIEHGLPRIP